LIRDSELAAGLANKLTTIIFVEKTTSHCIRERLCRCGTPQARRETNASAGQAVCVGAAHRKLGVKQTQAQARPGVLWRDVFVHLAVFPY
jgi:hypothetical protein